MSVRNLDRLFEPHRIAVVGASSQRGSVGNIVLRNLVGSGFGGVVYPINPSREAVEGVAAYALLEELPSTPDVALICTPAETVPDVVRACGECGMPTVVVLSAGFRETGPAGESLERRVGEEVARHRDLRVLGPNCLGYMVPQRSLNASFAGAMPEPGRVALVSQSGALASSLVDWAIRQGVGLSHVVSVGNMLDVDVGDVLDYLGEDPATRGLVLYVESLTDARKFMSAARAFTRSKPLVVYKAGRFMASAQAARSHTGVMTGSDAVYEAAFRRAGIVRERRIDDTFASAEFLARAPAPLGARLAIVTNAGGPGVMAADTLLALDGELATLSEGTLGVLDQGLPAFWSHRNPIDVLGDASAERYSLAVRAALDDDGADAVLVILSPQANTRPLAVAEAVTQARRESRKPLLAVWMGGDQAKPGRDHFARAGIAAWPFPEPAVGAFMSFVRYARLREALHETPRAIPVDLSVDEGRVGRTLAEAHRADGTVLSETASKALLAAYGIPVTEPARAASAAEAAAVADGIGYPVVLKVDAPGLVHKTDVGGVETGLASATEVAEAYARIERGAAGAGEHVRGVTVQPMETAFGYELILGARRDPTFGAVILVGAGGLASEVLDDSALELPPLNEGLARRMLESRRIWPQLRGHRRRPGADVDALLKQLMRFSYLVADHPEIVEIDVNPFLAGPERTVALDARVVLDADLLRDPPPRFSHLAIRPYPEELTRTATLKDGVRVTLRAIKPEDEPLWHDMLGVCSPESIRQRFRSLFRRSTHEMGSRYCFIDYDRELAIAAELEEDGRRRLIGVGRLTAEDPDHRRVEFALLVADPWQGRGLAHLLTDHCLEIARAWGVAVVYAETTPDNAPMLHLMQRHGFALRYDSAERVVVGELRVAEAQRGDGGAAAAPDGSGGPQAPQIETGQPIDAGR